MGKIELIQAQDIATASDLNLTSKERMIAEVVARGGMLNEHQRKQWGGLLRRREAAGEAFAAKNPSLIALGWDLLFGKNKTGK